MKKERRQRLREGKNINLRKRRKRTKIFGDEYHVILLRFRKTEKEKEENIL